MLDGICRGTVIFFFGALDEMVRHSCSNPVEWVAAQGNPKTTSQGRVSTTWNICAFISPLILKMLLIEPRVAFVPPYEWYDPDWTVSPDGSFPLALAQAAEQKFSEDPVEIRASPVAPFFTSTCITVFSSSYPSPTTRNPPMIFNSRGGRVFR